MTGSKLITSCHDPIEFVERDGIQKPIPRECTGPHSSEISRYQACPREAFCGDEIISVDTLPLEVTFLNNQLAAGAMCFYRFILMNQLHDTKAFDFLFSVSEEIEATLAKGQDPLDTTGSNLGIVSKIQMTAKWNEDNFLTIRNPTDELTEFSGFNITYIGSE